MRKHKIADICSKIRDYISEAGVGVAIILLVLLFFISMIVLCIIVDADKNHEMSISSGIIIDKYDCPGHGRWPVRSTATYANPSKNFVWQ